MQNRQNGVSKAARGTSGGANPVCWVDDHGDYRDGYALLRVPHPEVADDLVQKTAQICQALRISENNLSVMLHRARMPLRECLEVNWFENKPKLPTDE